MRQRHIVRLSKQFHKSYLQQAARAATVVSVRFSADKAIYMLGTADLSGRELAARHETVSVSPFLSP